MLSKNSSREISMKVSIDENFPSYILGDKFRLRQILINLISNSIKFTEKGEIRISSRIVNEISPNQVCYQKYLVTNKSLEISNWWIYLSIWGNGHRNWYSSRKNKFLVPTLFAGRFISYSEIQRFVLFFPQSQIFRNWIGTCHLQ